MSTPSRPVPTLLLDLMNTVLVPIRPRIQLYQEFLQQHGILADVDAISATYHTARRAVEAPLLLGDHAREAERLKWTRINASIIRSLRPAMPAADASYLGEMLYEWLMSSFALYRVPDSMREFLPRVRAMGLQVVIASNQEVGLLTPLLRSFDLDRTFDLVVVSDELGVAKPDPAFFAAAMVRARSSPDTTAFMGNNPLNDMTGAAAAGIGLRILLDYRGDSPDSPTYVRITNPNDALSLLNGLVGERSPTDTFGRPS